MFLFSFLSFFLSFFFFFFLFFLRAHGISVFGFYLFILIGHIWMEINLEMIEICGILAQQAE
jgi:hypothetical protein